jgi:two-component system response regulator TctD
MRLLLAEDNLALARSLTQALTQAGCVVDSVHDGAHADQLLQSEPYDVLILDLSLPRLDGLEVLRRLRARGASLAVLVLTARGDLEDRVRGLNAGADDYLAKPFELAELEARVRALGRRRQGSPSPRVRFGPLEYDSVARHFRVRDRLLDLPPREHGVLEALLTRPGTPVAKDAIAGRLCNLEEAVSADAIEIYVHRLRRRLQGSGLTIRTLRGLGYMLECKPPVG